jgi:hypothetical protein
LVDHVEPIADTEAIEMTRRLATEEGVFASIPTGANVVGAHHRDDTKRIGHRACRRGALLAICPALLALSACGTAKHESDAARHAKTTDGFRLLTVTVVWPHHSQRSERQLAIAIARPYLHTPHGKVAQRIVQGYPG